MNSRPEKKTAFTLDAMNGVIEHLGYATHSRNMAYLKTLLSYADLKGGYSSQSMDPSHLIQSIWNTTDPGQLRSKRKNLSTIRTSINKDLSRLFQEGKNPEGVTISPDHALVVSQEAKEAFYAPFADHFNHSHILELEKASALLDALAEMAEKEDAPIDGAEDLAEKLKRAVDALEKMGDAPPEEKPEVIEETVPDDDIEKTEVEEVEVEQAEVEEVEVELEEDDVFEEIADDEIEEVEDSLDEEDTFEEVADDEIEEVEDNLDEEDTFEEVADDEIEEVEDNLDEEDTFEEVTDDEIEEVEDNLDEDDAFEEIAEEPPAWNADEDPDAMRERAENFEALLNESERYYNRYIEIPAGRYPTIDPVTGEETEAELNAFLAGKYPITNALFEVFISRTGYKTTAEERGFGAVYEPRLTRQTNGKGISLSTSKGLRLMRGATWHKPSGIHSSVHTSAHHPVVQVSYEDAMAFASWSGKRLPTLSQWLTAGGKTATPYPWGEAWESHLCNTEEVGAGGTLPVDTFPNGASPFGVYDLMGNTLEWVCDLRPEKKGEPVKTAMGGSFLSDRTLTRQQLHTFDTRFSSNILGFRCIGG
ncbi:SUMF1/EgtB/PvdO family nonheme iron enzyme [Desulfoluna sp.]|uniref:SUMF1/EgtB/PvdO family nonheme iron enzyme n=1 Tax=Desulfoluna sp. TaxID=2045199 RepID=UPI00260D8D17|nr:SUMF1/EgtB/PvdO family nonheme iron enzyme [Desulfoluna sp.]